MSQPTTVKGPHHHPSDPRGNKSDLLARPPGPRQRQGPPTPAGPKGSAQSGPPPKQAGPTPATAKTPLETRGRGDAPGAGAKSRSAIGERKTDGRKAQTHLLKPVTAVRARAPSRVRAALRRQGAGGGAKASEERAEREQPRACCARGPASDPRQRGTNRTHLANARIDAGRKGGGARRTHKLLRGGRGAQKLTKGAGCALAGASGRGCTMRESGGVERSVWASREQARMGRGRAAAAPRQTGRAIDRSGNGRRPKRSREWASAAAMRGQRSRWAGR